MGLKTNCDGCGAVSFASLQKIKGRYLCTSCAVNPDGKPLYYCNACHNFVAKAQKKGSTLIEIVLYLCWVIPGLIYSIWRRNSPPTVCPLCQSASLVPAAAARPLAATQTNSARDEIDCPYCAEKILARASICKHCGKQVRLRAE